MFAAVLSAAAAALPQQMARQMERKGWKLMSESVVADAELIHVVVAVAQSNTEFLEEKLLAMSTPSSAQYGQHLSNAEVNALVAPSAAAMETVRGWFSMYGITAVDMTPNGDFVGAVIDVAHAKALLGNATFARFHHARSGTTVVRPTAAYELPARVSQHVDFVAPMASFPQTESSARLHRDESGVTRVTPKFLRKIYGLTDADVGKGGGTNNTQAIASFIQQYYAHSDNTAFWKKYPQPGGVVTPFVDVPTSQPHSPVGTEAALDTQCVRRVLSSPRARRCAVALIHCTCARPSRPATLQVHCRHGRRRQDRSVVHERCPTRESSQRTVRRVAHEARVDRRRAVALQHVLRRRGERRRCVVRAALQRRVPKGRRERHYPARRGGRLGSGLRVRSLRPDLPCVFAVDHRRRRPPGRRDRRGK